ncbi:MAG TPA: PHP domain-containing protein [Vicinamibacterales bacterium]|nr:PHP domain-containing protein [Vicinamibacterales bacterium]
MALTLGRAWEYFERAVARLARVAPPDTSFFPTGGLRRVDPIVIHLGVLARTEDPDAILREGPDLVVDGQSVRVGAYRPSHFGAALIRATGASAHVAQLNARADGDIDGIGGASEDAVYAALGLPCIPPEIRDGRGELERADGDGIPALVSRADIRGDLHLHTNYSDGRDDVETLVAAAAALGYEYIAITDHSPSSAATRVLSEHSLLRQLDEIDEVQLRHPEIRVLKGVETDIMPDGSLDLPDQTLERLDIVLASLHDEAGHSPEELLERYRHAAEHPLVNVLTHPANQIIGRRPGYRLDYDRLFEIAVETGTLLEIDGAASHLDLEGPLARRAAEAGVTLIVDSDSHHARLMGRYMLFGVGTARRGWLEARHVANTRPLGELQAIITAKRGGKSGR